jgi:tetratricopeptide (TPR) repeat protein
MPIDFGKLSSSKPNKRPIDPIELFRTLNVTDPAINELWLVQGDALREWHSKRNIDDIAIVLNTGAGKTLLGLLIAQSLVNETNEPVVYACGSIQLVEQTAIKAQGYGLDVTTYFRQDFSNNLYQRGLAPCLTTYQGLFNGKSRFFRGDIRAVVFDDSHTAEHLLRDQFSLTISRNKFGDLYSQITQLFRSYHARIGQHVGYIETVEAKDLNKCWLVPPFAVREQISELERLLRSAGLSEQRETKFAWEYLKNHIDLCLLFVSGWDISLTPPIVPVRTLPYFRDGIRRVYLSATLAAGDEFLRAFGKIPVTIAPETTAGKCERLIIIPSLHSQCNNDVAVANQIVANRKALILVPSNRRAKEWENLVTGQQDDSITEQVENFKKAPAPATLLLVSRYDGVDLPGDTCRVMVIDDLPSGVGPLERFLWEQLDLVKSLRSTIASRVVQSFGRISRGMSDHGVVVLTGKHLKEWLLNPKNQAALPQFLKRQLELGINISESADSLSDIVDVASQCLERDSNWIGYYQREMESTLNADNATPDEDASYIAQVEVNFGHSLWLRDYVAAAKYLEEALDRTFDISSNTGAWHVLWLGYCYELMGNIDEAHESYRRAHSVANKIPPLYVQGLSTSDQQFPSQVLEVATYLHQGGAQMRREIPKRFDLDLAALEGKGSSTQTEEALRSLGQYLGLTASRPDNEFGTGPDVVWKTPDAPVLSLEAKTEKQAGSVYRKKEVGQLRDHAQWVRDKLGSAEIFSAFVGPIIPASSDTNPDPDIMVIELAEFKALAERLRAALEDICKQALPTTLPHVVLDVFQQRNLLWPDLYTHIQKHVLRDIKTS